MYSHHQTYLIGVPDVPPRGACGVGRGALHGHPEDVRRRVAIGAQQCVTVHQAETVEIVPRAQATVLTCGQEGRRGEGSATFYEEMMLGTEFSDILAPPSSSTPFSLHRLCSYNFQTSLMLSNGRTLLAGVGESVGLVVQFPGRRREQDDGGALLVVGARDDGRGRQPVRTQDQRRHHTTASAVKGGRGGGGGVCVGREVREGIVCEA